MPNAHSTPEPVTSTREPYQLHAASRTPCKECSKGEFWVRPPYAREAISCQCLFSEFNSEKMATSTASPASGSKLSRIFGAALGRL
ncbi:hypothetical protein JKG47_00955 [Acidithiobacillus sp. MC6.1]|nr:hypothetical protein [Acidithiobacillus sp. MC6.1]